MKQLTLALFLLTAFFGFSPNALAMDDPDLEGTVIKIDAVKSIITIRNSGPHAKLKKKEKKVLVKGGMISSVKLRDYVQVRLMADKYEAKMIEERGRPPMEDEEAWKGLKKS